MYIVKSVGVMSVAKIMGLAYGCVALVFVPIFLLMGLAGSFAGQEKIPFAGAVMVGFAILMPFFYAAMGFIGGAIGAFFYNLTAKWVGGFELELELRPAAPVTPYPVIPPAIPAIQS